jgi:murein DD-endopeptidase MepM/ murein hydrolase activator NlpD
MYLRTTILAAALAASVSVSSAHAQAPATLTPGDAAPAWNLGGVLDRGREMSAAAGAWIAELPGLARNAGARLQLHLRDIADESRTLLAVLMPFMPAPPDLTPLVASPVPGVESSGFGWRRDPIRRSAKFHKGTDFRADRGTPVYAAGAGLVAFTGRQRGYGKVIYVDHGGGVVTRYAHLHRIEVEPGAPVDAGGRIGQVGSTGRTTGPHLHFEVRLDGRAVDPTLAMHVAELQRTDPSAAQMAAIGLSPDAQGMRVDRHDPVRPRAAGGRRPERRGAPVRDRTLW